MMRISQPEADEQINGILDLELEKNGRHALLTASTRGSHPSWRRSADVYINITVEVPEEMHLKIDDSAGNMEQESIHGITDIEDGSGDSVILPCF